MEMIEMIAVLTSPQQIHHHTKKSGVKPKMIVMASAQVLKKWDITVTTSKQH